jgi:diguanylate cyclase (GGDEF)-like protein
MTLQKPELALSLRVGAGFLLAILLMAAVTVVGLLRMAEINHRIDLIVNNYNVKVDLAHTMRNALRERAILMHSISVIDDPFSQNDEFIKFNDLGVQFTQAREKLIPMLITNEEKEFIEDMQELTIKTQPLVVSAIAKAMSGNQEEAQELISGSIIPLQTAISTKINHFIKKQEAQSNVALDGARVSYQNAKLLMILLGSAAAVLGAVIAVVVIRNATKQANLLQHQAMYDNLTQLPNRALFADRLEQAVLVSRREKQSFALIAMDIDRFKEINDTFGHYAGDEVLRIMGDRIRDCLRESDTVARIGGDEFMLLLPTATHAQGAEVVAKRISHSLKHPMLLSGREVVVQSSMGIALFPEHGENPESVRRHADAAMYSAKRSQIAYKIYSSDIEQVAEDRPSLQTELRHAIADHQLILHYQPKIDFETNTINGAEALVRWQHPEMGLLYPDKFVQLAEQTGVINALTEEVLAMGLQQCRDWIDEGLNIPVAVNISAINVQDPQFPDRVAVLLDKFDVPPTFLELEVTETAVMVEPTRAVECLKRLSDLGVQVSIDDFGTGYSSMSHLKDLLVAKIKIDRSFVKDMEVSHSDAVIVRSTIELGHNLGLKVIAEGVETQNISDKLKELGCDSAQGYYFSRPVEPARFVQWLKDSSWKNEAAASPN